MWKPTLRGAYGRDYRNKREIIDDLNSGKDFYCEPMGTYINLEGILREGFDTLNVRFHKLTKVAVITFKHGKAF